MEVRLKLRYNDFVKQAIKDKKQISERFYYVCNYEHNKNNLFKKVSANLKPTKIKLDSWIDSEIKKDSNSSMISFEISRCKVATYKKEKNLNKCIDLYNQNSSSYAYIFEDKQECLDFYLSLKQKHIDSIRDKLILLEQQFEKNKNSLQDDINNL